MGLFEKFKYLKKLMTNKKISFHSFILTVIAQISESTKKYSIVACKARYKLLHLAQQFCLHEQWLISLTKSTESSIYPACNFLYNNTSNRSQFLQQIMSIGSYMSTFLYSLTYYNTSMRRNASYQ